MITVIYPSGPTRLSGLAHPHQSSDSGGGRVVFGKVPLPGLAVVRSRDGGASVFNLACAMQAGYVPIVLEDRPLSLGVTFRGIPPAVSTIIAECAVT